MIPTPEYIIGLAYHELGAKSVNINVPETFPNNTAIVISLRNAYHYGNQVEANVNIAGTGRTHITTVIWSTLYNALNFGSASVITKQFTFTGTTKTSVNKLSTEAFGRAANTVLSQIHSPANIYLSIYMLPGKFYVIMVLF